MRYVNTIYTVYIWYFGNSILLIFLESELQRQLDNKIQRKRRV